MTQENLQQKLRDLDSNTEFVEKMAACESIEEMVDLFHVEGIDVDAQSLESALNMAAIQQKDGELGEDALESVSGGILFETLCAAWMCCNIVIAGCNFLQNTVFKKK